VGADLTTAEGKTVRLTKRIIDRAAPVNGEETWIWDADVRGLFLRVYATGRKSFAIKYRVGRRQHVHTIGPVGAPWTIEMARHRAREIQVGVVNGVDPQAERKELRDALTIGDLIEAYLREGPIDKPNKRQSTWVTDRSNLERHVRPLIGKLLLNDLATRDCAELQRSIVLGKSAADVKTKKRGRAIVSGGPGTAMRTMITFSAMLSWAVKRGIAKSNPAKGVPKLKCERQERFLATEEFAELFKALREAEAEGSVSPPHGMIIRLLAFTGARKSEIMGLQWSEVDLPRNAIVLAESRSKTGAKRIPLPPQAIELLKNRPRQGDYVFPPLRSAKTGHTMGLQKTWERVRTRAKLDDGYLHDLRHSFASMAVASGESLYVVQRALGHKNITTTQRYAHLRDDPLLQMVGRVAGAIESAKPKKVKA